VTKVFTLPTKKLLKEACEASTLELKEAQLSELERVVYRAHADLTAITNSTLKTEHRKALLQKMENVDSALEELLSALDVTPQDVKDLGTSELDVLDPINVRASALLTQAIGGQRLRKTDRASGFSELSFENLVLVLPEFIAVKKTVASLLVAAVADKGGRTPDLNRHYLVAALVRSAKKILGHPAVSTEDSDFIVLVNAVFFACGLPEKGSDKIVERTLNSLKGRK